MKYVMKTHSTISILFLASTKREDLWPIVNLNLTYIKKLDTNTTRSRVVDDFPTINDRLFPWDILFKPQQLSMILGAGSFPQCISMISFLYALCWMKFLKMIDRI